MKTLIAIACLSLTIASAARADNPFSSTADGIVKLDDNAYVYSNCQNSVCETGVGALNLGIWTVLLPLNVIALTGASTSLATDSRVQYIGIVQGEAAQYVADNGTIGAILRNAIDSIRAQNDSASSLDDKSIAQGILH